MSYVPAHTCRKKEKPYNAVRFYFPLDPRKHVRLPQMYSRLQIKCLKFNALIQVIIFYIRQSYLIPSME